MARAAAFGQRAATTRWIALAMLLLACGTTPLPIDDARHFRVGLDARTEANAIEARLHDRGWETVVRVDGPDAVGLAMRGDEGRTALRVITRRGVVLAVEAPTESLERTEVGLIDAPPDLDGDGFVELLPAATDAALERRCFALLRVLPDGSIAEVTPSFDGLGGSACLEALSDLDGDGRFEVVANVRFTALAWGSAPAIALPFAARLDASSASSASRASSESSESSASSASSESSASSASSESPRDPVAGAHWVLVTGARGREFFERERGDRSTRLLAARESGDVAAAYRLGVELAALARFRGADTRAQIDALRGASSGLVLGPTASHRFAEAVSFIQRGWVDEARESERGDEPAAGDRANDDRTDREDRVDESGADDDGTSEDLGDEVVD